MRLRVHQRPLARMIGGNGGDDQLHRPAFLAQLNAGSETVPGVAYTMVATKTDEVSVPYTQAFLTAGAGASAVAYVEAEDSDGHAWWGVGMSSSILDASLEAVISAANRRR